MFDFVKVISKKYMTLYNMINSKNLIYIASLKFINNIKFIFENKLFYNIMGYNLNINKDENILESVRKYHKFYSSYFVVDKKYNNIFNIYYTCLKDKNEKFKEVKEEEPNVENQKYNYFYDENRHIEICYDLMLFFQLLIIAKEINKKNYYNIMNIKKWKSYLKKYIYNNTAEKNNKYDKHNNNNNNNNHMYRKSTLLNEHITATTFNGVLPDFANDIYIHDNNYHNDNDDKDNNHNYDYNYNYKYDCNHNNRNNDGFMNDRSKGNRLFSNNSFSILFLSFIKLLLLYSSYVSLVSSIFP